MVDVATKREFFTVNRLAAPIMVTSMVNYFISVGVQIIVGHLGASELAAAALGTMYMNAFGNSFALGLCNAVDVLSSQAFGAKNLRRIGTIGSRGLAINLTFTIPIALLWWYAEYVLRALNQPEDVVGRASTYLRFALIGLPGNMCYEIIRRTFVVVGLAPIPLMISVIGAATATITGYTLVYHTSLGFVGAPIAISLSQWLQLLVGICLVRYYKFIIPRIPLSILRVIWAENSHLVDLLPEDKRPKTSNETAPDANNNNDVDTIQLSLYGVPPSTDIAPISVGDHVTEDGTSDAGATTVSDPNDISPDEHWSEVQPSDPNDSEEKELSYLIPDAYVAPVMLHMISEILAGVSLRGAFRGWYEYLFLGLPSAIMLLVEWGSYETTSIIAGLLGTETLAAHSIIATTVSISYMVPLGYGIAIGIRLGQSMGNRDVTTAKLVYRVGIYCVMAFNVLNGVFILLVRNSWPRLFTNVDTVTQMTAKLMWICAIYSAFDTLQCIYSAVLRAMSKPTEAAVANIIGYLGVGLILAYTLGIKTPMGLKGIWIAFLGAVIVSLTIMIIIVVRTDWHKATEIAYNKSRTDGASDDNAPLPSTTSAVAPTLASDSATALESHTPKASDSHKIPLAQKDSLNATVALDMIDVEDAGIVPTSPFLLLRKQTTENGRRASHIVEAQENGSNDGNDVSIVDIEHAHNGGDRPTVTTSTTDMMYTVPSHAIPVSDPSNINPFPVSATDFSVDAPPTEAVPVEVSPEAVFEEEIMSNPSIITVDEEETEEDLNGIAEETTDESVEEACDGEQGFVQGNEEEMDKAEQVPLPSSSSSTVVASPRHDSTADSRSVTSLD